MVAEGHPAAGRPSDRPGGPSIASLFISGKCLHLARLQQSHIVGVRLTQRGQGGVNRVAGLIQQSRTHFLWKGTPYPNFD